MLSFKENGLWSPQRWGQKRIADSTFLSKKSYKVFISIEKNNMESETSLLCFVE